MDAPGAKVPALLVDAMLGTLARRLRWLGYDAEYRADLPDDVMMRLARSSGRLLVTRDRDLARRCRHHCLYVAATELSAQLQAVMEALGPSGQPRRCTVCNGELETITPAQAAALVPPYVAQTQTRFGRCRRCRRLYWRGTHWPGLQRWRGAGDEL
ncbi:MAG: hypothetical protein GXP37_12825 [Chloroflexi bacterium]|nr:hypothetical protein [Chloroflexota bacterium]